MVRAEEMHVIFQHGTLLIFWVLTCVFKLCVASANRWHQRCTSQEDNIATCRVKSCKTKSVGVPNRICNVWCLILLSSIHGIDVHNKYSYKLDSITMQLRCTASGRYMPSDKLATIRSDWSTCQDKSEQEAIDAQVAIRITGPVCVRLSMVSLYGFDKRMTRSGVVIPLKSLISQGSTFCRFNLRISLKIFSSMSK